MADIDVILEATDVVADAADDDNVDATDATDAEAAGVGTDVFLDITDFLTKPATCNVHTLYGNPRSPFPSPDHNK